MSGSITASASSLSITFLAAQFPAGFMDLVAIDQAEELMTPGVDGRRWRTIYKQFPSFQMTTISEAATYNAAAALKKVAEKMVQKLVRLTVVIDAVPVIMREVHVSAVAPRIFPGPIFGAGTGINLAHIENTWQVELTDFFTT